jgi:hypothetical protein
MIFYDNILASSYRVYAKFKNERPHPASVFFTYASQILAFFLMAQIIRHYTSFDILAIFPNKFYFGAVAAVWMVLCFVYYSEKRVNKIVERYETKPMWKKHLWGFMALLSIVGPLIYFLSQGVKHH